MTVVTLEYKGAMAMALIEDGKGRQDEDSGYGRVFGNSALGKLISRVHVCSIRNGNELEKLLWEETPYKASTAALFAADPANPPIHPLVMTGRELRKEYKTADMVYNEVKGETDKIALSDFIVLIPEEQQIAVVEMKDGDTFDTKKADGELYSAQQCRAWLEPRVQYPVNYYFCAFNSTTRPDVVRGIKERFTIEQVLTGREFCRYIGVNYDSIRILRQDHQAANRAYFVEQLISIPEMHTMIMEYVDRG